MSLAMSNSKKFEIGVEVDKNLDSYPFAPILPLVVVLANPVNVTALKCRSFKRLFAIVTDSAVWFGR